MSKKIKCPNCGNTSNITSSFEPTSRHYSTFFPGDLHKEVEVFRCPECNYSFTSQKDADQRDKTVKAFLRTLGKGEIGSSGTREVSGKEEIEKIAAESGKRTKEMLKPDYHGNRYKCEREDLVGGFISDDELANEVYMNPSLCNLTAAKDRIRWLSRKLDEAWEELKGPDNFATWKDAAIHERVRRVAIQTNQAYIRKTAEEAALLLEAIGQNPNRSSALRIASNLREAIKGKK